jgi:hypothetical protein
VDGAERGEILQCHLGRSVRADLHSGVRSAQLDVRPGDAGHAQEVVAAAEECGEGGGERHVPADGQADRGGDQLLFGDEHLEEPVRVGGGELPGVGGVADLAVQDDHLGPGAERDLRVPVSLAGGDPAG